MTTVYENASGAIPAWTRGDRLRKARESAGLSQQELADAIGISRRSVSAYESNGTTKRPVLLSWALLCHVPMAWLADETEPVASIRKLGFFPPPPARRRPRPDRRRVVRHLVSVPVAA